MISIRSISRPLLRNIRCFSYPSHDLVPMPALSPTMEAGTIAGWLIEEGGAFSTGDAICEVETDKATVTFDATDDGFLAKILVGTGEIAVGEPLMITVEEESDVAAFKDYVAPVTATVPEPVATPPPTPPPVVEAPKVETPPAPVVAAAPVTPPPVAPVVAAPVAATSTNEHWGTGYKTSPIYNALKKEQEEYVAKYGRGLHMP